LDKLELANEEAHKEMRQDIRQLHLRVDRTDARIDQLYQLLTQIQQLLTQILQVLLQQQIKKVSG
jgi:hypothetical protein